MDWVELDWQLSTNEARRAHHRLRKKIPIKKKEPKREKDQFEMMADVLTGRTSNRISGMPWGLTKRETDRKRETERQREGGEIERIWKEKKKER